MDFWEGEFLGKVWAHTDFEDRKHPGFHFFIGFIALISFFAVYFSPRAARYFMLPAWLYLVLALLLLCSLPFFAARYQSFNKLQKILLLLGYALQYGLAWCFVLSEVAQLSSSKTVAGVFTQFGEAVNNVMATMSDFFSFLGGINATLLGVITGALLIGLIAILVFILVVYLPLLYFFVLKRCQRFIDGLILRRFYPQRLRS